MDTTATIWVIVAVGATALLVVVSAAEASIIAISRSRLRRGTHHGLAELLERYIQQRQQFLRALSVAATAATVCGTVATVLLVTDDRPLTTARALLAGGAALGVAMLLRQTARAIALLAPESVGVWLARPIALLHLTFGPLAWVTQLPVSTVLRALGRSERTEAGPAAELLAVLQAAPDGTGVDDLTEERRMMRGILAMPEQTVRELMSPRIDIRAVPANASLADVLRLIAESGLSRIPVYRETIDHVIGVIYAKDLLAYLQPGRAAPHPEQPNLEQIARPPYFVPETKHADDLLSDLRRDKVHMAIVVDEYGGTAGVVTVEDLLEEIVGEIADEYDTAELGVQRTSETEVVVDARLPIDDLNELFGTQIESGDFDTVGGLLFSLLGRLAVPGDEVESEDHLLRLRVLSILGRRIKQVRVQRLVPAEAAEAD